jgi:hypothetical protein
MAGEQAAESERYINAMPFCSLFVLLANQIQITRSAALHRTTSARLFVIVTAQFIGNAVAKPPHPDGFPTTYEWAYAFLPRHRSG